MAKQTINVVERHLEKAAVGIAAALLLAAATYFLILGVPFQAPGWTGDSVRPDQIGSRLEDAAKEVTARWSTIGPPPKPAEQGPAVLADNPFDIGRYADLKPVVPSAQPWPLPLVEGEQGGVRRQRPLVAVVAPAKPMVSAWRNVLRMPGEVTLEELAQTGQVPASSSGQLVGEPDGVAWIMAASYVDLSAQEAEFRKAGYPPEAWDFTVFDVQMQRRTVTRTRSGDWYGRWENVSTWVPYIRPEAPEVRFNVDGALSSEDRVKLNALWARLRTVGNEGSTGQKWVLRPDPPERQSGDTPRDPLIPYLRVEPSGFYDPDGPPAAGRGNERILSEVRVWRREAERARDATPPDLERAYLYAEAAYYAEGVPPRERDRDRALLDSLDEKARELGQPVPPRQLRRRMPVVAYELDIAPGLAYQVRMRLRVLNRFAGRPNELASVEDAKQVFIEGAWSPPSDVIDVPSDVYLFLSKASREERKVTLEVFRKVRGGYEKKQYKVGVGEYIGREERMSRGTVDFSVNALVVDIDFDYVFRPPGESGIAEPTAALIYTDPRNPAALALRVAARDAKDLKYEELKR